MIKKILSVVLVLFFTTIVSSCQTVNTKTTTADQTLSHVLKLAQSGNGEAQFELGNMFISGQGVKKIIRKLVTGI